MENLGTCGISEHIIYSGHRANGVGNDLFIHRPELQRARPYAEAGRRPNLRW